MHAKSLQCRARRERGIERVSSGAGQQDLAPVAGFEQAGHPAERRPEVIAVPHLGLAGVQRHAHAQSRMGDRIGFTAKAQRTQR